MRELLVIDLSGMGYGVWKDAISEMKEVGTIHRLPMIPPFIAGIAITDSRTTTLADLSACLGYPPLARRERNWIFTLSDKAEIAGFAVGGKTEEIPVSDSQVLPIPTYLKTEFVHSVAIIMGRIIPVIDIGNLYRSVLKNGYLHPEFGSVDLSEKPSLGEEIRLALAGGKIFAFPTSGLMEGITKPERIAGIPFVPEYVRGITLYKGTIMPLLSLAGMLEEGGSGAEPIIIPMEFDGGFLGLLIDRDEGVLHARDYKNIPLPILINREWMGSAIVCGRGIVPVIEPLRLMVGAKNNPIASYTPSSDFEKVFRKKDVEVVEFLILGMRYSVPKSEAREIIAIRDIRPLPQSPPIVIGISEYNGELLPVVDLALCFNRSSVIRPGWSMIVIENGDFRAIVVTEKSFAPRHVNVANERDLPVEQLNGIVYGCYLDAADVRIILNIEAMAVCTDWTSFRQTAAVFAEIPEFPMEEIVAEGIPALEATVVPESALPQESTPYPSLADEVLGPPDLPQTLENSIAVAQLEEMAPPLVEDESPQPLAVDAGVHETTGPVSSESEDEVEEIESDGLPTEAPGIIGSEMPSIPKTGSDSEDLRAEPVQYSAGEEDAIIETTIHDSGRLDGLGGQAISGEMDEDRKTLSSEEESIAVTDSIMAIEEIPVKEEICEKAEAIEDPHLEKAKETTESLEGKEERTSEKENEAEELSDTGSPEEPRSTRTIHLGPVSSIEGGNSLLQDGRDSDFTEKFRSPRIEIDQASLGKILQRDTDEIQKERGIPENRRRFLYALLILLLVLPLGYLLFYGKSEKAEISSTERPAARVETTKTDKESSSATARSDQSVPATTEGEAQKGKISDNGRIPYDKGGVPESKAKPPVKAPLNTIMESAAEKKEMSVKVVKEKEPRSDLPQTLKKQDKARPPVRELKTVAEKETVSKKMIKDKESRIDIPESLKKPDETRSETYLVKPGDTLWGISKRFTGDPYNYYEVAERNSIANPDFIFPGQKINIGK